MNTPEHLVCTYTPITQKRKKLLALEHLLQTENSIMHKYKHAIAQWGAKNTIRRAYMTKKENGADLSERERESICQCNTKN
jgi:hypothetical protein